MPVDNCFSGPVLGEEKTEKPLKVAAAPSPKVAKVKKLKDAMKALKG